MYGICIVLLIKLPNAMNNRGKVSAIAALILSAHSAYAKQIENTESITAKCVGEKSEKKVLTASQIGGLLAKECNASVPVYN